MWRDIISNVEEYLVVMFKVLSYMDVVLVMLMVFNDEERWRARDAVKWRDVSK